MGWSTAGQVSRTPLYYIKPAITNAIPGAATAAAGRAAAENPEPRVPATATSDCVEARLKLPVHQFTGLLARRCVSRRTGAPMTIRIDRAVHQN